MHLLLLIPARSGSKGIPGKNLRTVGGLSLIARTVLVARGFLSETAVPRATILIDTDSEEIADEAREWGAVAPFLRPRALANDDTPMIENALLAIGRAEELLGTVDAVMLLQPTSPLRDASDLARCWMAFDPNARPSVMTVTPAEHPIELGLRVGSEGTLEWASGEQPRQLERQSFSRTLFPNGAVYVASSKFLRGKRSFFVPGATLGVEMPRDRSVDIDEPGDLLLAEALLRGRCQPEIPIGAHRIGSGAPCFLIAEAGVNHNGREELAHRLIDVAAAAGVDAVKFQTFTPHLVASAEAARARYQVVSTGEGTQLEMLRQLTLPLTVFRELRDHAAERDLIFLSTPFDSTSADFLEELDVPAFKISSGELTNHPFLQNLAGRGRPLLLSTGMSTLVEVADAVELIRSAGNPPLALLHCVSSYPAAPSDCNLRAMETLRTTFGVPVGWSDHTVGLTACLAAAALGAHVIEKHFTVSRTLPGPDHAASLEPGELSDLVSAIRMVEALRGDGVKRPVAAEADCANQARRSLHAARDLSGGHRLSAQDFIALRPGDGIPPSRVRDLVGRRLTRNVTEGRKLEGGDVE